jgi:hypothetical protein
LITNGAASSAAGKGDGKGGAGQQPAGEGDAAHAVLPGDDWIARCAMAGGSAP